MNSIPSETEHIGIVLYATEKWLIGPRRWFVTSLSLWWEPRKELKESLSYALREMQVFFSIFLLTHPKSFPFSVIVRVNCLIWHGLDTCDRWVSMHAYGEINLNCEWNHSWSGWNGKGEINSSIQDSRHPLPRCNNAKWSAFLPLIALRSTGRGDDKWSVTSSDLPHLCCFWNTWVVLTLNVANSQKMEILKKPAKHSPSPASLSAGRLAQMWMMLCEALCTEFVEVNVSRK